MTMGGLISLILHVLLPKIHSCPTLRAATVVAVVVGTVGVVDAVGTVGVVDAVGVVGTVGVERGHKKRHCSMHD